jgi:hypothetical protein
MLLDGDEISQQEQVVGRGTVDVEGDHENIPEICQLIDQLATY